MLTVLASGHLLSNPKKHVARNRKEYCTAMIRVLNQNFEPTIATLISFDDQAVAALLALRKGDSCCVTGAGSVSIWKKGGKEYTGISILVHSAMTLCSAGKSAKPAPDRDMLAKSDLEESHAA